VHIKADSPFRQTSIICELDPKALHDLIGFEIDWNDRRLEGVLDLTSNSIRYLLRKLAEEARGPGIASAAFAELAAGQLAIEIGRHLEAIDEAPVSGGLAPWRMRIIDDRLKGGGEMPTLVELAELCSLSVRQLTRGFKTSRGCTIGDYVTQTRLETAKRRLSAGESIKSISHELGYTSPASFAFAFRRSIGITPRQFLNRVYRSKSPND
jgi:AraC family transcriptional regulator